MEITTISQGLAKGLATNAVTTSLGTGNATMTEPALGVDAGYGAGAGATSRNIVLIIPYAVGSDGNTFDLRVLGWRRTPGGLWVGLPVLECTCTVSAQTGATGGEVSASENFCDAISLATAYSALNTIEVVSPGSGNISAHLKLDFAGAQKIEFTFSKTTATSCNVLFAMY